MNVLVFIGGMAIGACLTAILGLVWEMRETRADLDVIRQDAESRYEIDRKILERKAQAPWN